MTTETTQNGLNIAIGCAVTSVLVVGSYFCLRKPALEESQLGLVGHADGDEEEVDEEEVDEEEVDEEAIVAGPTLTTGQAKNSNRLSAEETWSRAKFLFPELISLGEVRGKYMNRRFKKPDTLNDAVQIELSTLFNNNVHNLSTPESDEGKMKRWEDLNKKGNAEQLCVELGMNQEAVRFRFELMKNLERALPFAIGKTHILVSLQHVIDTIQFQNPFGNEEDMDGTVRGPAFKGDDWLSYFGIKWHGGKMKEELDEAEIKIKQHLTGMNGFFVHGTTGDALEGIHYKGGELRVSKASESISHDFGDGFYCFKDELRWALSFAVDRCWPIQKDENDKPMVRSCNPAVMLFPKHDETLIQNEKMTLHVRGKAMSTGEMNSLKSVLRSRDHSAFATCRKKWVNEQNGYWKDFVKLSLIYQKLPPSANSYGIFYGPMHSCEQKDKPTGEKVPQADPDGYVQYCIREQAMGVLGEEMLFLEFNIDWDNFLDTKCEMEEVKRQFGVAQEEVQKSFQSE